MQGFKMKLSERPRRLSNEQGVRIAIMDGNSIEGEYIVFKFIGMDHERLPSRIAPVIVEDRIYFVGHDKGYTLTEKGKYRMAFALSEPFRAFAGEYSSLEYDEEKSHYYISKNAKIKNEKNRKEVIEDKIKMMLEVMNTEDLSDQVLEDVADDLQKLADGLEKVVSEEHQEEINL